MMSENRRVSRVIFMCGPAGSGKSTVAGKLEADGMTRLSIDEEARQRGIVTQPFPEDVRREIEGHLRGLLVDLATAGTDVVLDYSFWSRAMRDEYRAILRPLGVEPETIYVATLREVALGRVRARNGAQADDVRLPDDVAAHYYDHFEAPTSDEGPLTVVSGDGISGPRS